MTSSAEAQPSNRIADVRFDGRRMYVLLQDGRDISVPLWWYPRLLRATPGLRCGRGAMARLHRRRHKRLQQFSIRS